MSETFDVIIMAGEAKMGSSTAYHLAAHPRTYWAHPRRRKRRDLSARRQFAVAEFDSARAVFLASDWASRSGFTAPRFCVAPGMSWRSTASSRTSPSARTAIFISPAKPARRSLPKTMSSSAPKAPILVLLSIPPPWPSVSLSQCHDDTSRWARGAHKRRELV